MNRKLFYLVLPMLLVLGACKNGADSLPELSNKIFKALQKNDLKLFSSCHPSKKEMNKALRMYLPHEANDKKGRRQEAKRKAAAMEVSLNKEFQTLGQQAKEMGLDWGKTKIINTNYILSDHQEDYKDAKVRVILETNHVKNVINYKAYLLGNRWYLVEGLRWEE